MTLSDVVRGSYLKMSLKEIVEIIRARTRGEWTSLGKDYITEIRIWLQENGEIAALVGLILGIFIVLFFKLFIFLVVFGGLVGYTIWHIAEPLDDTTPRRDTHDDEPPDVV